MFYQFLQSKFLYSLLSICTKICRPNSCLIFLDTTIRKKSIFILRSNLQQSCSLYLPHELTLWTMDRLFTSLNLMVKLLLPSTESTISLKVFAKDQLTGFSTLLFSSACSSYSTIIQESMSLLLLALSQVSRAPVGTEQSCCQIQATKLMVDSY